MNRTLVVTLAVSMLALSAGCAVDSTAVAEGVAEGVDTATESDALFETRKLSGTYRTRFAPSSWSPGPSGRLPCATESYTSDGAISGFQYELRRDGTYSKALYVCDAAGANCRDLSLAETRARMNAAGRNADAGISGYWSHRKVREFCHPDAMTCPPKGLIVTLNNAAGSEELHAFAGWSKANDDDLTFESSEMRPAIAGMAPSHQLVLRASRRGVTPMQGFDACTSATTYITP